MFVVIPLWGYSALQMSHMVVSEAQMLLVRQILGDSYLRICNNSVQMWLFPHIKLDVCT